MNAYFVSKIFEDLLNFMCKSSCPHICMSIMYVPAHDGQKRRLDDVELELQMVVSQYMCVGNKKWVL